jgi:hypothetical protein
MSVPARSGRGARERSGAKTGQDEAKCFTHKASSIVQSSEIRQFIL